MSLFFEYGGVLLILIILEGLLAVDNAVVLAVMVKHLPKEQQKKALFYGLLGAVIFRLGSLFIISLLVDIWQIQAIGALYLLYMSISSISKKIIENKMKEKQEKGEEGTDKKEKKQSGFWMTVLKVEVADIAFAIDSMLAAVALGITLPLIDGVGEIGGMHAGHFVVIFLGGIIGVIIMRFAATTLIKVLEKRPNLEFAAFIIVGWVGVKLTVLTLCHEKLAILPVEFAHSELWKYTFYGVLILIAVFGWILSKPKKEA